MLVRIFGLFGVVLGAAYFNEGVGYTRVLAYALSQEAVGTLVMYLLFVTWDFLFGLSLIVAGIGMLLLKEWARLMWLGIMPALVLVHLGIIVAGEFGGVSTFYLVWTGMVVLIVVASWWYLTEDRIRVRFSGRKRNET